MEYNKEEGQFRKRLLELAHISYNKGICTYTDFLSLNEINLFYSIEKELPGLFTFLYGGYTQAERKILCFYNKNEVEQPELPIACIHIKPVNAKFSNTLTHRDFLGAILNLGISRSKIGDILIDDNECYVFCNENIVSYIVDNLYIVKHTNIVSKIILFNEVNYNPRYITITGTVASCRLDAILPLAFKASRSNLSNLISSGKVYVNGKLIQSNRYQLKEGDIVSVRGHGKFQYKGEGNQSKKGRTYITLQKYN